MQQVRDGLRNAGLTVWTDEGIEPGTVSWKTALSDAITNCTSVVVLFSPDSAQSTWVNRELDFAELHNKKLYPLLVRGDRKEALPFGYTSYQFIDMRNDDNFDSALEELLNVLRHLYPTKLRTVNSHPQIIDTSPSETAYKEIIQSQSQSQQISEDKELLWKWYESSELRFVIPQSWKLEPPTNENLERMWLLNKDIPNVKEQFFQYLQEEDRLLDDVSVLPINLFSLNRIVITIDITDLSMVTGMIVLTRYPRLASRYPLVAILLLGGVRGYKNITPRYGATFRSTRELSLHHGRIMVFESTLTDTLLTVTYMNISYGSGKIISWVFSCDTARYEAERDTFDRIALSMQFV